MEKRFLIQTETTCPVLLIADSGSTKTTWCLVVDEEKTLLQTAGINPVTLSDDTIATLLDQELCPQLTEALPESHSAPDLVYFYGAGCLPNFCKRMEQLLLSHTKATEVFVASDLWGAVYALCGNNPGIACILGTGANSCLYDGTEIVANTPPLGYILGDEGSGAHIGKCFLGNLLKGLFDDDIYSLFMEEYELNYHSIIQKVYREPNANRFMASLTPFLLKHRDNKGIHSLLVSCFTAFIKRNIVPYKRTDLPLHFVGSIAWHFKSELQEAAEAMHYQIGKILPQPIHDLVGYHMTNRKDKHGI